jgi:hypothetical protein
MPVTTLKRCQSEPEWWFTVEDCNVEVNENPSSGLCVRYYDSYNRQGKMQLSVGREDALLIRDAINQLYPPEKFPSK